MYESKYRDRKKNEKKMYALIVFIIILFFTMVQLVKQRRQAAVIVPETVAITVPITVAEMVQKKEELKLFCGIPFKVQHHALGKIDAILNTWGRECDGIGFFVDRGDKAKFDEKHQPYIFEIDMKRMSGEGKGLDGRPAKHILER